MLRKIYAFLLLGGICGSVIALPVNAQNQIKQIDTENIKQADISPQALEQITSILAEKKRRIEAQRAGVPTDGSDKLSLQVIAAVKAERGESFSRTVEKLSYKAERNELGYVALDIRATVTKALLAQIEQTGGSVFFASEKAKLIQAYVPLSTIENLATRTEVEKIDFAVKGETNRVENSQSLLAPLAPQFSVKNLFDDVQMRGSVNTQGDTTHRAALARSTFGVTGAGVKIGVLSDSVRFLAQSQASGDLPNVTVIPGQSGTGPNGDGGIGEGTAMLEIIADVAPGAQLYFATAFQNGFQNPTTFANNIRALRNAGCNIIVDDAVATFGPEGTPFQESTISQAINDVTASGVLYLSAAGNSNNQSDLTSGTWEGDFKGSGQFLTVNGQTAGELHSYNTRGSAAQTRDLVSRRGTGLFLLWWADGIGTASSDYDMFLLDQSGTQVIAASTNRQDGTGGDDFPFEAFGSGADVNSQLVIVNFNNSPRRALHVVNERGGLLTSTTGNVRGHNAAANALSIAATPAGPFSQTSGPYGPYPNVFDSTNEVERFSSDGPRRVFFNADNSPITRGNFLFSTNGGRLLNKVDLTGADGVSTTSPVNGLNPFFGTSAAAPHIAAIAALVKSAKPSLTRTQIISILNSTAIDIEAYGRDRDAGAGIVDAYLAVQAAR